QGSAGPLIGVAISASLLPPVVNCVTVSRAFPFCRRGFRRLFGQSFCWIESNDFRQMSVIFVDNLHQHHHDHHHRNHLGLFWALACIWLIYKEEDIKMPHLKGEPYSGNSSYEFIYTNYIPTEFLINGIVSGLLTVINVICIFITAIIVLKIKEVAAPYTSSPDLRR
uniref:Uncharacterized protein n=1 Tax=Anopheles maculatus TaxID=74869 RepID=A0A182SXA3_9DIPT